MKSILYLLSLLSLAQASFAQLSGPLSGTLGPGTFHVVGEISVESGNSLTLQPGTTFHFDGPYPFRVYGTLLAEGTENDSIIFTTDTLANPDRWRGLRFSGSSCSGGRLEYCVIEFGHASGADENGGGVNCSGNSSPTFANCVFRNNSSISHGGGISLSSSSPSFSNCIIRNNSAPDAAGIDCFTTSSSFTNCTIQSNSASLTGGGITCFGSSTSPSFTNCIINNNSAIVAGGIWGRSNSTATFVNCVISGNSSITKTDGFECDGVSFVVINCIITGLRHEAIHFDGSPECRFENCCIVRPGGSPITFDSSNPNEGPPGIGELVMTNINNDSCDIYENIFLGPRFVDGLAGDFHLADYSPCIGAGQTGGPAEDMDGNPRPNPPGSYSDIGAYENELAAPGPFEGLSGILSGTMGPGVYPISDTIYINEGETLRLLPGTVFLFGGPYSFEINGTLLAEGTEEDSIVFTSDIPLPNPGLGLHFSGTESSGSQLAYCVFEYGYSTGGGINDHGGAAYCDQSSPSFTHCVFRYNGARSLGGAAYCLSSSASFSNCTFAYNVAYGGGGVHCYHYSPVTFTNCIFIGNAVYGATSYGGAISCYESRPSFTDCDFHGNHSESDGGAVRCEERSWPTFAHCSFTDNWSESYGGAVYCQMYCSPDFTNCVFTGNSSSRGGAIYSIRNSSPIFTDCPFSDNTASFGGALFCWRECSPMFTHCTLIDNSTLDGGAVYCDEATPSFTNCTLSGNSASRNGGCMYSIDSSPSFNSTAVAFTGGEGMYFWNSAGSQIEYCDIHGGSGNAFAFYNDDSSQGPPDIGRLITTNTNDDSCDIFYNIFLDPMFVDTISSDYHLSVGSPCIDAGDPELAFDPDTTIADIGAFYFDQVAVDEPHAILPLTFALHQNYPNPFNPTTNIRYDVAQTGRVTLTIYNLLGQQVTQLIDKQHQPGSYTISWTATHLPSGLYFCRMQATGFTQVRKLLLVK